jgi:hypothetical protein
MTSDSALCTCGHPASEHVPILGCAADCKPKDGVGVEFACACETFSPAQTENDTTESYPLSRGD